MKRRRQMKLAIPHEYLCPEGLRILELVLMTDYVWFIIKQIKVSLVTQPELRSSVYLKPT